MDRRHFLYASALAGGAGLLELLAPRARAVEATADHELRALLDAFFDEDLVERPQSATMWGLDTGAKAVLRTRLNDYSIADRERTVARHRARLERLRRIPRERLTAASQVDRDVIEWSSTQVVEWGARYPFGESAWTPYAVSQMTGPYQSVPDFLASTHPIQTTDDAEAYLQRLSGFARALEDSTAMLEQDASRGVIAPDFALDTAIAQLERLRSPRAAQSNLAASLSTRASTAGLAGGWQARAADIVARQVYPAVAHQLDAVRKAHARSSAEAGVWRLKDGEAFYAGALAYQTSTRKTPEEIHGFGREKVAELTSRLDALLRKQGMTQGTVAARIDALSRRPDQLYPNTDAGRADLLAALNAQAAAMRAKLPLAFRTLPASPFEIVRVPPDIEAGAPNGYARGASLDGTRPGRYYINLKDTSDWPKFALPTLTYHEALPGHVWQGSIARESTRIPLIRRLGGGFAAYGEGWALYAEQLADELGMYEADPLGRIGYLQSLLFRAVRLVVDTGLHAQRWSRSQATDYMVDATAMPRPRVQREIDRYCVSPGQACSYAIGYAEWVRVREESRRRAGHRFDLRAFHDVLLQGRMPLLVLERVLTTTPAVAT
jgi:uncharacterized protein (DUF885 family)